MPTAEDTTWMRRALRLARRGWGRTTPNPMVGAVIVRAGKEVGSGYHHRAGAAHAEVNALAAAGTAAHGATLYVNLEPCSTQGRTPPCTEAIKHAGVARVVVGCRDPNPSHAGRGIDILRGHGIDVDEGTLQQECARLNEAFFGWIRNARPFVVLKMAMTLDGKIATAGGESQWLTGAPARRRVQRLRQAADAIMVGAETVRQDNPSLTVRTPQNWWRQPRKIIWTRRNDCDHAARVWADPEQPPHFVRTDGRSAWLTFLRRLGRDTITCLLIEGGGELAAAALAARVVDKVQFFIAPTLLGGRGSRSVVAGANPASLQEALRLADVSSKRVGADLLITGYLSDVHRPD